MRKTCTLYVLMLLLACSCDFISPLSANKDEGTGDQANYTLESQINDLDTKIFAALKVTDYNYINSLLSDELKKEYGAKFKDEMLPHIASVLQGRSFSKYEEFYVEHLIAGTPVKIESVKDGPHTITCAGVTKKTYVSVLMLNGDKDDGLLTIVYGWFKGGWKITSFEAGEYKVKGRFARDFYKDAQRFKQAGELADATNAIYIAMLCSRPAGDLIKLDKDAEIRSLNEQIKKEADSKFHFPMPVAGVPTNPMILGLQYQYVEDGLYPLISYHSNISLKDTAMLRKENNNIRIKIPEIFHGLTTNNKYILYKAYNELPDGKKDVNTYGFVQKNEGGNN